jgi:hypothetical protein
MITEHRQEECWDKVCENISKSIKDNDSATAFSIIRRMRGGSKRVEKIPVDDKTGKLFVNSRDTLKCWRTFFCENLNVCSSVDQNLIDQIQIRLLSTIEEHIQSAQTSIQEVKKSGKPNEIKKSSRY